MLKPVAYILLFTLSYIKSNAQSAIIVAENTFKVAAFKEEVFYYGFAEGDQMIFNFDETSGKELKEIEISEMPLSQKFMDFKSSSIQNKILLINRTGIYKFRFSNNSVTSRICKILIQRIPKNEATKNFNTAVFWLKTNDTSYVTSYEKYLIGFDTTLYNLSDQVSKVHSKGNLNGNKTTFNFTLPENTVAWSYYIGVNQAGQKAYQAAAKLLATKAGPIISKIPGYGPAAALALGGISYLTLIQSGEDIDYYLVSGNNRNLFLTNKAFKYIKKGKVINDFSQMLTPLKGSYHICLLNDNAITGVTVAVKITAITVTQQWGERKLEKMIINTPETPYLKN